MLRLRVIDRDYREPQQTVAMERAVANDASRRLFSRTDNLGKQIVSLLVNQRDNVARRRTMTWGPWSSAARMCR